MKEKLLILTKFNDEYTSYLGEKYDATIQSVVPNFLDTNVFYSLILIYCDNKTEVLKYIKSVKKTSFYCYVPLMILTHLSDTDYKYNALKEGVYDIISFPISTTKISNRIDATIDKFKYPASLKDDYSLDKNNIYSNELFIKECVKAISLDLEHKENYHMIRLLVSRYLMISYTFGKNKIDSLIKYMSDTLINISTKYDMLYGKGKNDDFFILFDGTKDEIIDFIKNYNEAILNEFSDIDPDLVFGITDINDYERPITDYVSEAIQSSEETSFDLDLRYNFYSEKIKEKLILQEEYQARFEDAIKNHEFVVYYQPKFDIINDVVSGAEALVRWKVDDKIIPPGSFIPLFEKNGNIAVLDYYVWEEVCKYLLDRKNKGLLMFPISVNVSRVFLTMSDFVERLDNLLLKYDIEPKYLELEITETIFTDVKIIKAAVSRLREHGFKILMDDFGSAYSSLNVLKEIDFDVLKIDMKFFSTENKKGLNIIKSVLDIANSLDVPAIAEGVESYEYVKLLRQYGCNYVQGYYYSKPLPEDEFNEFVIKNTNQDDLGKFINFYHLNEAVYDFTIATKNYIVVTKKDIAKLLKSFLKELDVDSIAVGETSADGKYFEYIAEESTYLIKPVLGKQIELNDDVKVDAYKKDASDLIIEFKENELPQVKCKRALMFPIANNDTLIGGVFFFRFKEDKSFTLEEERALLRLSSVLSLPIYKETSSKVYNVLDKQNKELEFALDVVSEYKENASYMQLLFINSLKTNPTVFFKYNFETETGWEYTADNNGNLVIHDRPKMKESIDTFVSLVIDDDIKKKFNNILKDHIILDIPSRVDVLFDITTKKQTITPRHVELNIVSYNDRGKKALMATVIDKTREYDEFKVRKEESLSIRDTVFRYLVDNFVSLSMFELDSNTITTYYKEGSEIRTKEFSVDEWYKYRAFRLNLAKDTEDKKRYFIDSTIENQNKLPIDVPYNYNFVVESNSDIRYLTGRLIVNIIEGKKVSVFLLRDITNEVKKQIQMNHNLDVLADMVGKDQLTQLYNRNGLIENIDDIKEVLQDGTDQHFLVFLDADLFKQINDKYGHNEGDHALTEIARVLNQFAKTRSGFAYRYGGDEFILILNYYSEEALIDALDNINLELKNNNNKYLLKISYGIEMFSSKDLLSLNEESLQKIINSADKKLIEVKKKNNIGR